MAIDVYLPIMIVLRLVLFKYHFRVRLGNEMCACTVVIFVAHVNSPGERTPGQLVDISRRDAKSKEARAMVTSEIIQAHLKQETEKRIQRSKIRGDLAGLLGRLTGECQEPPRYL